MVNNAATNVAQGSCLDVDEGQFDKMVEINKKSAFLLCISELGDAVAR